MNAYIESGPGPEWSLSVVVWTPGPLDVSGVWVAGVWVDSGGIRTADGRDFGAIPVHNRSALTTITRHSSLLIDIPKAYRFIN